VSTADPFVVGFPLLDHEESGMAGIKGCVKNGRDRRSAWTHEGEAILILHAKSGLRRWQGKCWDGRCMVKHFLPGLFLLSSIGFADNTIVRSGYTANSILTVAPGQILQLDVRGVGAGMKGSVSANSYPWPDELAGISVMLHVHDSIYANAVSDIKAPIFLVEPTPGCLNSSSFPVQLDCAPLTKVSLQIPYSVPVNGAPARLSVWENGAAGDPIDISIAAEAIRAIAIVRSDGSIVSPGNAAAPGENLALFAYGLGSVSPPFDAGQPAPYPPAIVTGNFRLSYDVRYEAPPFRDVARQLPEIEPSFIGLVPGVPGLYQVNFQAPPVPAENRGCPVSGGIAFFVVYRSNVTINLSANSSFDGIGICVKPQD